MTDAQTEARAIVSAILVDERLAVGYQIETLADAIVEHIATALTAKDAELAVQREAKEHARRLCDRAEARLAEARKAMEPFALATILPTGEVVGMDRRWFDAARRALTGGKADG